MGKLNTWQKVAVRFGLVGGGLLVLLMGIFYGAGREPVMQTQLFDFVLFPMMLFLGMIDYRNYRNDGVMTYTNAMRLGGSLTIIAATLTFVFVTVLYGAADPEQLDRYKGYQKEIRESMAENVDKELGEGTAQQLEEDAQGTTFWVVASDSFLKKMAIGLIFTAVYAMLLRRKPKPVEEPNKK